MTPGRSCPLHYRYSARAFVQSAPIEADTLYVVGGLYGNMQAWRAVEQLFLREPASNKQLVLNGDFHWFDVDPALFAQVEEATSAHRCLRGNVETELATPSPGVGCGCAYPDAVDDGTVERSNRILQRLQGVAQQNAAAMKRLAALPMHATAQVGKLRLGLVHGDAESLAGWGFDPARMADVDHQATLADWFAQAEVDVFASSHTCTAGLKRLQVMGRDRVVINSGAAGMPCLTGKRHGVISRIAVTPAPAQLHRLYGTQHGEVHIDAIAIPYDADAWDKTFLSMWPEGSDAHRSYWSRIAHGPKAEAEVVV